MDKDKNTEILQFKNCAYKLKRIWYFPFIKQWVQIGKAKGNEPHMFPAPTSKDH